MWKGKLKYLQLYISAGSEQQEHHVDNHMEMEEMCSRKIYAITGLVDEDSRAMIDNTSTRIGR
jgi:hypothetical protein